MIRPRAFTYPETGRIVPPVVFEPDKHRHIYQPIGFDRAPEIRLEVVTHVPEKLLRDYRAQLNDRREGRL